MEALSNVCSNKDFVVVSVSVALARMGLAPKFEPFMEATIYGLVVNAIETKGIEWNRENVKAECVTIAKSLARVEMRHR